MPSIANPLAAAARAVRVLRPTNTKTLAAAIVATMLVLAGGAQAASAYQNPFAGDTYYTGRTDMGVDVCLTPGEPIRAVGDGVVVGHLRDWFAGQPYLWYRLSDGPSAGRYVYVSEQINHLAPIGATVHAGQVIARYARHGTCIETGWSASSGWTWAQVTTGYSEGQRTRAGVSFARFLITVGVHGPFDIPASDARAATARKKRLAAARAAARRRAAARTTASHHA
jgi:hypothetical protein